VLRPARAEGMAAALGVIPRSAAGPGLATAVVGAMVALPLLTALIAVGLAAGVSLGIAKLAQNQIGGYTGDVLGAGEVITECVVLTAVTCVLAP
jgi:adenosylcobinamide-GDP ribazoletransferase